MAEAHCTSLLARTQVAIDAVLALSGALVYGQAVEQDLPYSGIVLPDRANCAAAQRDWIAVHCAYGATLGD